MESPANSEVSYNVYMCTCVQWELLVYMPSIVLNGFTSPIHVLSITPCEQSQSLPSLDTHTY